MSTQAEGLHPTEIMPEIQDKDRRADDESSWSCSWNVGSSMDSIYKVSRKIKRKEHSLYNSLRSIYHDSLFVGEIQRLWPELPLLANLRCGLWYSPHFDGSCYFKSTDGHTGNWSFNPTRLNIHVANLAAERGGCFIVDATRRGKRFPDSMSKTIPIWACILNRAIYKLRQYHDCCMHSLQVMKQNDFPPESSCEGVDMEEVATNDGFKLSLSNSSLETFAKDLMNESWDCSLHLPIWVSKTEKSNIENHIDEWVKLLEATGADLGSLAWTLKKPLRPLWISQTTVIWLNEVPDAASWSFTPIILVSASHPTSIPERDNDVDISWRYIPGAADDEESWARGLTPVLFWRHAHDIVYGCPEECNKRVADIVERDRVSRACRGLETIQVRLKSSHKAGRCDREGIGDAAQECTIEARFENFNRFANCTEERQSVCGIDYRHQAGGLSLFHWIGDTRLSVSDGACAQTENALKLVDCAINCGVASAFIPSEMSNCYIYLPVVRPKFDRFSLQKHLPAAVTFASEKLKMGNTILIFCSDGEDASVCVCLAILLSLYDQRGQFDGGDNFAKCGISKWNVRQCLVFVCKYVTNARPSRGGLRQVYNFLAKKTSV
eukprot:c21109_g1_i2 orf=148-1971(-)